MDKEEAVAQVKSATDQGLHAVTLRGTDSGGDILTGNNESFQLKKPIGAVSNKPAEAAVDLYEAFSELVDDGVVKVNKMTAATKKKIIRIWEAYFDDEL
ncbi:hypothetical protein [Xanthomonas arboricola]|uniref:hypothetical protein n=1 Tax=Xanthomonas arboricola TaxID=56448 RepID=UPI0015E4331A|nr:hypothetical protein [Xanthomonas arboricola]